MKFSYQHLNSLNQDQRLTTGARVMAHDLARLAGGKMAWFKWSHAYLAGVLKVSVSTVKRRLDELTRAGWLLKRANAAVINGLKVKIANSYRLCVSLSVGLERKARGLVDQVAHIRKGFVKTALWLKSELSKPEQNKTIAPAFELRPRTAYEAVEAARERMRLWQRA